MARTRTVVRLLAGGFAAAAAVAALPAAGAPAAGSYACGAGGRVASAGGGWLALSPSFGKGAATVLLAASPVFDPDLIYATNGAQLARSTDGGCTWRIVLDAAAEAASGLAALPDSVAITSVATPSSANASAYVYVGLTASVAGVTRPVVAVSGDRGGAWTAASATAGLPATGAVDMATATADIPQNGFVVVRTSAANVTADRAVYATADGGKTWTRRTAVGSTYGGTSLLANPLVSTELYGVVDGTLSVSNDGGGSFAPMSGPPASGVGSVDLEAGSGGARIGAARKSSATIDVAAPGVGWRPWRTPVAASDIAVAPLQPLLAMTGAGQTYLLPAAAPPARVTPKIGAPSQLSVSAPTASGYDLTGVVGGVVVRATVPPDSTVPTQPPGLHPVTLLPAGVVRQFPALLTPLMQTVTLAPGRSVDVPYRLLLPRIPTPLDVMFLIDTTGSMGGVIDGLRQDLAAIASALDVSGLDVEAGLGDFKDYPDPYGGGVSDDYPYRSDARIQPPGAALQAAIANLIASGGGDEPESDLTALYQSTTGAGDEARGHVFVPRGKQAGYRAKALRLAVLATDSPFHRGGEPTFTGSGTTVPNPGPTMHETIAQLVRHGVYQVGLAAGGGSTSDLTKVAAGTHTLAPAGGVDCDGNGTVDVPAGMPLVCPIGDATSSVGVSSPVDGGSTGTGPVPLTGAVIGLAEALPDHQPVGLAVTAGATVATVLSPSGYPAVNVKADNELAFQVHLHCPAAGPRRHDVRLSASAAGRAVSTGGLVLECVPKSLAGGAPTLPAAAAPVRGVAAGSSAAEPAANVNPNPQPNPNPNPQPNPNPNMGFADQKQEQQQLAFAEGTSVGGHEQMAMSRLDRGAETAGFVLGAGVMTAAAAGLARRRAASWAWR